MNFQTVFTIKCHSIGSLSFFLRQTSPDGVTRTNFASLDKLDNWDNLRTADLGREIQVGEEQLCFNSISAFGLRIQTIPRSITAMQLIKSVAVIGAGPAGAIAVDALMQENAFDVIRVFERQEKAGGCWYAHSVLCSSRCSRTNFHQGFEG